MKHLFTGALLLVCLLVAGAFSSYGVQQAQAPITAQLEQAAQAGFSEDWILAETHFSAARSRWEKYHKILATFVDHTPMEEIDGLFAELEIYKDSRDSTLFSGVCLRLCQMTQTIGEAHQINWWNLL